MLMQHETPVLIGSTLKVCIDFLQLDRPDREGDFDALLPIADMKPLDELMLDQCLVCYVFHSQNDVEIDAGLGKAAITDNGFKAANTAGCVMENLLGGRRR